jgi:hypothetical protein
MPVGKCPMCLRQIELVRSHLIPAALYDYCRTDCASPVRVGDGVIMHTDRQTQAFLLRVACEDILNKGGESWTNTKLATVEHVFPLYEFLMNSYKAFEDKSGSIYFTSANPDFDFQSLTHFAMGIFWKASVHSWKGDQQDPLIELGPYSDPIRTWLRGERGFPNNVCITVTLSNPQRALVTLNEPTQTRFKKWHTFLLHVPGALFMLNTGKTIEADMRNICFYVNPAHPVFVSEDVTGKWNKRLGDHYRECRKSKGYLEFLTKRSKEVPSE